MQHWAVTKINIENRAIWFGTVPRDEGWAKEQLELQLEQGREAPLLYGLIRLQIFAFTAICSEDEAKKNARFSYKLQMATWA